MRKAGKPVLISNDTSIIVQPEDLVHSAMNQIVVEQELQEAVRIEERINADEEVSIDNQDHPFKVHTKNIEYWLQYKPWFVILFDIKNTLRTSI